MIFGLSELVEIGVSHIILLTVMLRLLTTRTITEKTYANV